jgi:hypothetical protein
VWSPAHQPTERERTSAVTGTSTSTTRPIDAFLAHLQEKKPLVTVAVDPAVQPQGGTWFDLTLAGTTIQVSWQPDRGFGLHSRDGGCGDRPYWLVDDPEGTAATALGALYRAFRQDMAANGLTTPEQVDALSAPERRMLEAVLAKEPGAVALFVGTTKDDPEAPCGIVQARRADGSHFRAFVMHGTLRHIIRLKVASGEPVPPELGALRSAVTLRGRNDPLGYDTSDWDAAVNRMLDDVRTGRTRHAIEKELAGVRRAFGTGTSR